MLRKTQWSWANSIESSGAFTQRLEIRVEGATRTLAVDAARQRPQCSMFKAQRRRGRERNARRFSSTARRGKSTKWQCSIKKSQQPTANSQSLSTPLSFIIYHLGRRPQSVGRLTLNSKLRLLEPNLQVSTSVRWNGTVEFAGR